MNGNNVMADLSNQYFTLTDVFSVIRVSLQRYRYHLIPHVISQVNPETCYFNLFLQKMKNHLQVFSPVFTIEVRKRITRLI